MAGTRDREQPIIIIKKKVAGHGGHHGGAWKVAYADFVTAMMALFIVLWLLASSEKVKAAVSDYFIDPQGTKKLSKGGDKPGSGTTEIIGKDDLKAMKEKIEKSLQKLPDFQKIKDQVEMTITAEGLRIELMENKKGVFFEMGRPQPTSLGTELVSTLATSLGSFPNSIVVEGHTDAAPYHLGDVATGYSNWELSADRANEARKVLQQHGVRKDQVKQVRGFADQHLKKPNDPEDSANRRISVIVQYRNFDEKALPMTANGTPTAPGTKPVPAPAEKAGAHGEGTPAAGGEHKSAENAGHGSEKKAE